MTVTTLALGGEIRRVRKALKLSQERLAERVGLNLATVAGLEASRGTVASLQAVLHAMGQKFSWQHCPDMTLGEHLADRRRKLGLSLDSLVHLSGVSKPSLMQVESGRGHVATLCAILAALRLPIDLVPHRPETGSMRRLTDTPRSSVRRVIVGDCLSLMRELPPGCVDLVITSPPYNAGKPYEERLSLDDYAAFAEEWVGLLPRLLSPRGAFWLNVGFMPMSSGGTLPLTYLYHPIAQAHGFHLVQEIVWHYEGGMKYTRRFAHRTERWMWFVRDSGDYAFFLDRVRDPLANLTDDERNHPLGRNPTDYWYYDRVVGGRGASREKTSHPCQTPIVMVERIVQACSRVGDVVLDPFAGSGSVAVAADQLGRGFIAIERDERYAAEMRARLGNDASI